MPAMPSTSAAIAPRIRLQAPPLAITTVSAARANPYRLQLLLLLTTFLTTTLIGMRYMYDFELGQSPLSSPADIFPYDWAWTNLGRFADGLPFSLTLIAILLAHEFGHYAACRYYGLEATLPFLFPAPTLSGTFGAVIRIRSRIKSRAALLVVGASGPIAGFLVAIATTCYGLVHSTAITIDAAPSMIRIGAPGLMGVLRGLLLGSNPDIPPLLQMVPHPVLVASWIGLLITSINLIPAGQLDGGHILYALSPRAHKITHHLMIGMLLYLGTAEWIGWLFWAVLLMLPGMRHPKVADKSPLGAGFVALALLSLVIFALTACTQPSTGMSLIQLMARIHWGFWIR
jgi:membrane-associated protease RseP (regulator of RpoE activity)